MYRKWLAAAFIALAMGAAALPGTATAEETAPGTPPAEEAEEAVAEAPPAEEAAAAPPAEQMTLLDETCNSGHVCVWTQFRYQGVKGESLCTGGSHPLAGYKGSAKNRCANKAVWLRDSGSAHYCVNAGGNLAEDFIGFNEIWVGAEGSHC